MTLCPRCKTRERNPKHGWCKQCLDLARAVYRKNNPEAVLAQRTKSRLKTKYNLTLEKKNLIILEQRFKCAACDDRLNPDATHIDHCHSTGKVRGILCSDCNISLGRMKENPDRIYKLAAYAERIKAKE